MKTKRAGLATVAPSETPSSGFPSSTTGGTGCCRGLARSGWITRLAAPWGGSSSTKRCGTPISWP
eukprot:10524073-Lingulodinium_polyedra.AAC.1